MRKEIFDLCFLGFAPFLILPTSPTAAELIFGKMRSQRNFSLFPITSEKLWKIHLEADPPEVRLFRSRWRWFLSSPPSLWVTPLYFVNAVKRTFAPIRIRSLGGFWRYPQAADFGIRSMLRIWTWPKLQTGYLSQYNRGWRNIRLSTSFGNAELGCLVNDLIKRSCEQILVSTQQPKVLFLGDWKNTLTQLIPTLSESNYTDLHPAYPKIKPLNLPFFQEIQFLSKSIILSVQTLQLNIWINDGVEGNFKASTSRLQIQQAPVCHSKEITSTSSIKKFSSFWEENQSYESKYWNLGFPHMGNLWMVQHCKQMDLGTLLPLQSGILSRRRITEISN